MLQPKLDGITAEIGREALDGKTGF